MTPYLSEIVHYRDGHGILHPLVLTDDGDLRCNSCDKDWCNHISQAIQEGEDCWQVWHRVVESPRPGQYITVPVRPSDDLRVTVSLFPLENNPDALKVISEESPKRETPLNPFIGFLNKGEGRIHLRQMIISWFEVEMDLSHKACTSVRHNWQRDSVMVRECDMDRGKLFVHCWRMVFSDLCNICFHDTSQAFDPDLIPGA